MAGGLFFFLSLLAFRCQIEESCGVRHLRIARGKSLIGAQRSPNKDFVSFNWVSFCVQTHEAKHLYEDINLKTCVFFVVTV